MYHPFSTIVNARRIGDNVTIRNNITIGNKDDDKTRIPTIGNNVNIGPGSIIFGSITIGDNVVIAAYYHKDIKFPLLSHLYTFHIFSLKKYVSAKMRFSEHGRKIYRKFKSLLLLRFC